MVKEVLDIMVDLARDGAGAGFPGRDHSLIENDDLRHHASMPLFCPDGSKRCRRGDSFLALSKRQ
ncbi:hypothetical protein UNPF46_21010 [Bradyrhizobium sp. UNPF46]|nr:hypothetical protein UNPF46_21010 [Bradyrhizobium sp. UNPF46]